jgi:hypothetical protein
MKIDVFVCVYSSVLIMTDHCARVCVCDCVCVRVCVQQCVIVCVYVSGCVVAGMGWYRLAVLHYRRAGQGEAGTAL